MGLLSFLSRKHSPDKRRRDTQIITQSYHTAAARVAPVRGDYPIGGNNSSNLQSLIQAHERLQSELSLRTSPKEPAPPPTVPTSRDEVTVRPRTAPNGGPHGVNWPTAPSSHLRKSYLSGQLPLSTSKSAHESLRAEHRQGRSELASVNPDSTTNLGTVTARSRPQTAHQRGNRVLIASGANGFKDILDAQAEFKPLDFKSRVKASGARDYGEDVADRNIEETHSMANMSQPYWKDATLQPRSSNPTSLESDRWTPSPRYPGANRYHDQRASHMPQLSPLVTSTSRPGVEQRPMTSSAVSQRQSLSPYSQTGPEPEFGIAKSKLRRLSYTEAPLIPQQIKSNYAGSNAGGFKQKPLVETLQPLQDYKEPATRASHESQPAEMKNAREDEHATRHLSSQRSFPLKLSARGRSDTVLSGASSITSQPPHSIKRSRASSIASYHTAIDTLASPLRDYQSHSLRNAKRASLPVGVKKADSPEPAMLESAPSPSIKVGVLRYNPGSAHVGRHQTDGPISSPRKLHTEERSEAVPVRSSSLRNWSISSETATTSDTGSNPFPVPQSPHTATTSVDLGANFAVKNTSRTSLPGLADHRPAAAPKPAATFDMDDYISSSDDDGSSGSPRRPRGEGEEDLLFSAAGYGPGAQLPGLFDSLASSPPKPAMAAAAVDADAWPSSRAPRTAASPPLPGHYYPRRQGGSSGAPSPRAHQRRYVLDTAADSDFYDDDDDEDGSSSGVGEGDDDVDEEEDGEEGEPHSWHHHRRRRSGSGAYTVSPETWRALGGATAVPRRRRHYRRSHGTKRLAAIGNAYARPPTAAPPREVIEEEERGGSSSGGGGGGIGAAARIPEGERVRRRAATAEAVKGRGVGRERAVAGG